jgi:exopolysaccharide biosynthesis WecB/TagA/CpsF family protein
VREAASGRRDALPVVHANAHNLHLLRRRKELLAGLAAKGRIFLEGIGMKVVARGAGCGWRRDANGTDMAPLVFESCAELRVPVYLLGGRPAILDQALQRLRERYPRLEIAGAQHGYLTAGGEARAVRAIRASGAALLVQGRGCPYQEEFSLRWANELGVAVVWNVGGLFDFLAGARPRAPRWVRRARLEWLFRLALEPRRLAPRSLVSFPALALAAARSPR